VFLVPEEHPLLLEAARSKAIPIYGLNYRDKRDDALPWLSELEIPTSERF